TVLIVIWYFFVSFLYFYFLFFFFFQAEDGIRDATVTGVQTCALPISHDVRAAEDVARVVERYDLDVILLRHLTRIRVPMRRRRRSEERRVGKECRSRGARER